MNTLQRSETGVEPSGPVFFPHSWVEEPPPMDDAHRAAGEMADRSDSLVRMMEDLKVRLRRRMSVRSIQVPPHLRRHPKD